MSACVSVHQANRDTTNVKTLALDIGGANIKVAHSAGGAWSVPFELWKQPTVLSDRLIGLVEHVPAFDRLAVTLTAELCDCFATKREGVAHVLEAAAAVAGERSIHVWLTEGRFGNEREARARPLLCAAANWHALATFVARTHDRGTSLLIDTGSTTTDIIRLCDGRVAARGLTDTQRLAAGELVYLGATRTPLMALGPAILFDGREVHVMAEHFATTADIFLLTGALAEQPGCTDTADGRPLTAQHAAARVVRMIGADLEMLGQRDAVRLAEAFVCNVRSHLVDAIHQVLGAEVPERVVVCGRGVALAAEAAETVLAGVPVIDLAHMIGAEASASACAYALVKLLNHVE